jgi:hypothetical protein
MPEVVEEEPEGLVLILFTAMQVVPATHLISAAQCKHIPVAVLVRGV